MQFAAPDRFHYAWVAVALLALGLFLARRRRGRIFAGLSFVVRAALCVAAVVGLTEPFRVERERVRPRVDLLLDGSRSVAESARAAARGVARKWADADRVDVRVLTFGDGLVGVERLTPAAPAASRPSDAAATRPSFVSDPHDAFAALALDPARGGARVYVVGDGRFAAPDSRRLVAPARGVSTFVPAPPDYPRGARVLSVVPAPAAGDDSEPAVEVRGASDVGAEASLEAFVDGAPLRTLPVKIPAGEFVERIPLGRVEPGRRVVAVRVVLPRGTDAEPLDDEGACVVDVRRPLAVYVVSPEPRPLVAAALKAQGLEPTFLAAADFAKDPAYVEGADVLVLDRCDVGDLSTPAALARLDAFVRRGGGLWFLPRDPETAKNELVAAENRAFLGLLPFLGREEPPQKKKDDPPPEPPRPDDPRTGLKPPDPTKKTTEKREAPSLGLLVLIDVSGSMRGQKLRLAQVAAVKAAEVLHPEDQIAVVAFSDQITEVLPLGPANDLALVRSQVSRLQAGGNTDFRAALEAARDVFDGVKLQIKHCILLSDGYSTTAGAFSKLARELRQAGVTVSTVGVGPEADVNALSNIAAEGGGKYQGAPDVSEVPQIFVVEAERVVRQSNARRRGDPPTKKADPEEPVDPEPEKRPPPRVDEAPLEPPPKTALPLVRAWPAAYLKGVKPETATGVFARHKVELLRSSWLAVKTEAGDPIVAHHYVGFGRVVAQAVALEGPSAGPVVGWEDFANFAAQVVRFLAPDKAAERFAVRLSAAGRELTLEIDDLEERPEPAAGYALDVRDQRGRRLAPAWTRLDARRRVATLAPDDGAAFVDVLVASSDGPGTGRAATVVGPPAEIANVGVDPAGLRTWADAVGGEVAAALPENPDVPVVEKPRRVDDLPAWLPWILAVFGLDVVLKRLRSGDFPAHRKAR